MSNEFRSGRRIRSYRRVRARFGVETLEHRRVLAVGSTTPAIFGTVFQDINASVQVDPGEGLENATVNLFLDDGDGIFEPGAGDVLQQTLLTDVNGDYCFDDLDPDASFFVQQPAQQVAGIGLSEQVSTLQTPSTPGVLIDSFVTNQQAVASPPAPAVSTSVLTFANESEVIGQGRDLVASLVSGDGEVAMIVNPFGTRETLRYNSDVAVAGNGSITWDGTDLDAGTITMGLNGRDLTNGGTETGIMLRIGAVVAGSTARMRFYQGNDLNFSEATLDIPVTIGGAATSYELIPFSSFLGPVTADDVDAIQLLLDAGNASGNDIELAEIGANGPKQVNFVTTPETDLAITKDNGQTSAISGQTTSYTVMVSNLGPSDVVGATVNDQMPPQLLNPTFTSAVDGNAGGNTQVGSGDINDIIDLTVGSSIIYTIMGQIDPAATTSISNTATIEPPDGFVDDNLSNNTATDTDTLVSSVDLAVTKVANDADLTSGLPVTYTIAVSNPGPSLANGATVVDNFPLELTESSYMSVASAGATGNTNGDGNINDNVIMPPGSMIVYTVNATVDAGATGSVSNSASVAAPAGTTELNPANNTATATNTVSAEVDLSVTKTNNVSSVEPGEVVNYQIVVQNAGPANASGTTIADLFPSQLTNLSYTSSGSVGVVGNSATGTGDIDDTVNMPAGSTLSYDVQATVSSTAVGTLSNTATVTPSSEVNDVDPNNNTATDSDSIIPQFDLSITKDDGRSDVVAGASTTYTIQVSNVGPSDISAAAVTDVFPSEMHSVTYSSSASDGASGNTNGTGNIDDLLNLPSGASVTYTAVAQVRSSATGTVSNTVTVNGPDNEGNLANNSVTDTNAITLEADLSVSQTDGQSNVSNGEGVTYTIIVSNAGPSDVIGASLVDALPSNLIDGLYTSTATGGASGNTDGTGNLSDVLNMPAGSTVTYKLSATVNELATGVVTNSVTITAPVGVTEINPANNTAVDTNTVDRVLRRISGAVYVDLNNNGTFDADEPPVFDVELRLTGVDQVGSTISHVTRTNGNGQYEFGDLIPGTYEVAQTQPSAFPEGRQTIGTGSTTTVTAADNVFTNMGVGSSEDLVGFNFGEGRPNISKRNLLASSFRR